jgi:hypothetical protein
MNTFIDAFGYVLALCCGVIILAVFFTALGYFKRLARGIDVITVKGYIQEGKLVNVHLTSGAVHRGLRFVGFTDQSATKGGVPYPLSQMVVCETVKGARVLFRPQAVRVIEEVEDVA